MAQLSTEGKIGITIALIIVVAIIIVVISVSLSSGGTPPSPPPTSTSQPFTAIAPPRVSSTNRNSTNGNSANGNSKRQTSPKPAAQSQRAAGMGFNDFGEGDLVERDPGALVVSHGAPFGTSPLIPSATQEKSLSIPPDPASSSLDTYTVVLEKCGGQKVDLCLAATSPIVSSVCYGDNIIFGTSGRAFYIYNVGTGTSTLYYGNITEHIKKMTLADDFVIALTSEGKLYYLYDIPEKTLKFEPIVLNMSVNPHFVDITTTQDGHLCLLTGNNIVYTFNVSNPHNVTPVSQPSQYPAELGRLVEICVGSLPNELYLINESRNAYSLLAGKNISEAGYIFKKRDGNIMIVPNKLRSIFSHCAYITGLDSTILAIPTSKVTSL